MSAKFFARVALSLIVTVLLLAAAAHVRSDDESMPAPASHIERGKYLVILGGCNDCHSPKIMTDMGPQPDPARLLSGHPSDEPLPAMPDGVIGVGPGKWGAACSPGMTGWIGAWGVTYAANLTPDKTTGIGNWTADQFIKAMRTGKHRGFGRPIMPPMPWFAMAQLQDDELEAIFAYLMSLPPIPNRVPDAVLNQ